MTIINSSVGTLVEDPLFPYVISDSSVENPSSLLEVELADDFMVPEPTLFYILDGELNTRSDANRIGQETILSIRHQFACDVEGDNAYVANFTLKSFQFVDASGNRLLFTAWLTEAKFYPDENSNPLLDEYDFMDEDITFPYLPKPVTFGKKLTLPVQVKITLHMSVNNLKENLASRMVYHAEKRAAHEARIAAEKERRLQQRKEREEWLTTPEGLVEVAETKFITHMKKSADLSAELLKSAGGNISDFDIVPIELVARDYIDGLTVEDVARLKTVQEYWTWKFPDNLEREKFVAAAIERLNEKP